MPYATDVKFFASDMPGTPAVFANAGGYVGWLDAVLVNGYGAAVLSQIVVTDGVAVATATLGHSLRKWMVALHADAGDAGLNGEHRVIAASGATYTFEVTGVPNGTYAGGTTKVAPLGFEISHTGTNRRIYRSKDPRRNAVSLYVDDTNTAVGWNIGTNKALTQAKMVCDVAGIDNYVTLDTTWWPKSAAVSGTLARPWMLAGDALGFYTAVDISGTGFTVASNHFMQLKTLAAGDQFATMLEGATPDTDAAATSLPGLGAAGACMNAMTMGSRRIARGLSQSGAAIDLRYYGIGVCTQNSSAPYGWSVSGARPAAVSATVYQCAGLSFANPADAGMVLGQNIVAAHSPSGAQSGLDYVGRAVMPGLLSVPSAVTWTMVPAITEAPAGMAGSNLLGLPACAGGSYQGWGPTPSAEFVGGYYVDITKTWR